MSIRLNKEAYEKLIKEDIEWLDKIIAEHSPNSLEGWHIRDVLQDSIRTHYGDCEDKEKLNVIDYLAIKLQETIGTSPHSFSTIREILLDENNSFDGEELYIYEELFSDELKKDLRILTSFNSDNL